MNRETAFFFKKPLQSCCFYCNKPGCPGYCQDLQGNEWPVCQECLSYRIKQRRHKRVKAVSRNNTPQLNLNDFYTGNTQSQAFIAEAQA